MSIPIDALKPEYRCMSIDQLIDLINNNYHINYGLLKPEYRTNAEHLADIINNCKHLPFNALKTEVRNMSDKYICDFLNTASNETRLLKSSNWTQAKVVASIKGVLTENAVRSCLTNFVCKKVNACSGDILIHKASHPNIIIMLEIKNYTQAIPPKEIEKFYRDLELNQFSGGVFISNQPTSGNDFLIKNNTVFMCNHDPDMINLVCEMLWARLFERTQQLMTDQRTDITKNVELLTLEVERLVAMKHATDNMQKTSAKYYEKISQEIQGAIVNCRHIINGIMKGCSSIESVIGINTITLPDNNDYFGTTVSKNLLEGLLNKIVDVTRCQNILLSQIKHNFEYNINGIKIMLEFSKSKIILIFKPKDNISLSVLDKSMSYNNGYIYVKLDKTNAESDIYEKIYNLVSL